MEGMSADERLMDLAWGLSMAGEHRAGELVLMAHDAHSPLDVSISQERLTMAFDACKNRAWRNRIQEESELLA